MKTQTEIEALIRELKSEIDHKDTTKERKAYLKICVETLNYILQ